MGTKRAIEGLSYYASTFDVVAWPQEEEGFMRVVASFSTRNDAVAFLTSDAGKASGALFVRPPHKALLDALTFVAYLLNVAEGNTGDVTPLQRAY
jgi:hypothetical protein